MPRRRVVIGGRELTLDARPDRLDFRDLPYRPPARALPPRYPSDDAFADHVRRYAAANLVRDQGEEGACTGFGLAAVVQYLFWARGQLSAGTLLSARMLYHLARFYDEWPGEKYDGSSCRGALKGWHKHGVCTETLWPYDPERFVPPSPGWDADAVTRPLGVYYRIDRRSVVDMQAAIAETGAIFCSADVHSGWGVRERKRLPRSHRDLPEIAVRDKVDGGHAFALIGYDERGFVVQNSWGSDWGAHGLAILPYEDWVTHGDDAWAMALGVPVERASGGRTRGKAVRSPVHFVSSRVALPQTGDAPGWQGGGDPLARRADAWTLDEGYVHTLVTGNDGEIVNHLADVADAAAAAEEVALARPRLWLASRPAGARHVAIYAHGGLNDRNESLTRIRVMGPWFEKNGIYPVFVTWQTGWLDTLSDAIEDEVRRRFGEAIPREGFGDALADASDRMIEGMLHALPFPALWAQMKQNAAAAEDEGRGLAVLAAHLRTLTSEMGGDLSIHFVGHSAGAYVVGRLLARLAAAPAAKIASCTLYAPACTLPFALDHFAAPIDAGVLSRARFVIHALSDAREQDDSVGAYRKSLLYLVSRAFESVHKTPLAGLASAYDAERADGEWWDEGALADVARWQQWFFGGTAPGGFADRGTPAPGAGLSLVNARTVSAGPRAVEATHGSFDNNVRVVSDSIAAMLGLPPGAPLPAPVRDLDF